MPIPQREPDEDRTDFLSRCMSNTKMNEEYPDGSQRYAVCEKSSKAHTADNVRDNYYDQTFGSTELITDESKMYIPREEDYVDFSEEVEEWNFAADKPGLWENIRKKKDREGKKYKPAKKGDSDRPDPESWKKAQSKEFKYQDPKTGEIFTYNRRGIYKKDGRVLILVRASEYQGRTVKLNKPFRTPKGPKKFSVYVKNDKGNIVKVNFGDPNMEIKRDDLERRKNFRARHQCDTNPGPKWKARYWSCKFWEAKKSVTDLT